MSSQQGDWDYGASHPIDLLSALREAQPEVDLVIVSSQVQGFIQSHFSQDSHQAPLISSEAGTQHMQNRALMLGNSGSHH